MSNYHLPQQSEPMSWLHHLLELRNRIIKSVVFVLSLFAGLAFYANEIYAYLADPLLRYLPTGSQMIAIEVASPFLIPFKLAFLTAVLLSVPFLLYQAWAFVAPGLHRHEKHQFFPLLLVSTLLFYVGLTFAYFAVFPVIFGFMATAAPQGVAIMTDIGHYLDFVMSMLVAFGAVFEVPIFTLLLVKSGIVEYHSLKDKRGYVIVAAFIIGAILSPPDVISQTLMAVPIWLLFEIGVLWAYFSTPKPRPTDALSTTTDS
ncbi:MAG: twin-arginine translocase subunit TatC [Methylomonas sp.]|nr:MAG: twin-arginine translocase subunit TatC [Methylomonas sp.]